MRSQRGKHALGVLADRVVASLLCDQNAGSPGDSLRWTGAF